MQRGAGSTLLGGQSLRKIRDCGRCMIAFAGRILEDQAEPVALKALDKLLEWFVVIAAHALLLTAKAT